MTVKYQKLISFGYICEREIEGLNFKNYFLYSNIRQKLRKIVFFMGSGWSGKTIFTNMLRHVFGEYATTSNVFVFLGKSVCADKSIMQELLFVKNQMQIALVQQVILKPLPEMWVVLKQELYIKT